MGYKGIPFEWFDHARQRASERGISEQDVREVLDSPDVETPSKGFPGRRLLRKKVSKKGAIGVVIVPPKKDSDPVRVVTVWLN